MEAENAAIMSGCKETRHTPYEIKLMPLEIERKFLLANDGWKKSVIRRIRIRDGLIATPMETRRGCGSQIPTQQSR